MEGKISVIVPIYNQEQYLNKSISSIINQKYDNLEIILINDGSTDSSIQIIDDFALTDSRIRVFSKPNGGLVDATIYGVNQATGEYIAFLDPDDYIGPLYLWDLFSQMDDDIDFVASGFYRNNNGQFIPVILSEDIKIVGEQFQKLREHYLLDGKIDFSDKIFISRWNKLYRTNVVKAVVEASIQKAYPEYDVKQINYLCQKHYKQYYSKYPIDPIWKKNFYKSLGKYLNPFSDYHKRRKNFPKDYNSIPHTEQFTASQLSLYEMDCLVLGSDIIWDYSFAFFDNDPYLFGNGLKAKKKVAYACSFGTVSNHDKHPEYVIDGIKGLDYISVRDENSADIVEEITGIRPPVVLDPTWLWDFSDDNNIIKPKFDNYIIVYGVLFTKEFINQTIEYSHEKGYKLICLACNDDKYDWCDVLIQQSELSVFEWLGLFKYAEKVVTSTYHTDAVMAASPRLSIVKTSCKVTPLYVLSFVPSNSLPATLCPFRL